MSIPSSDTTSGIERIAAHLHAIFVESPAVGLVLVACLIVGIAISRGSPLRRFLVGLATPPAYALVFWALVATAKQVLPRWFCHAPGWALIHLALLTAVPIVTVLIALRRDGSGPRDVAAMALLLWAVYPWAIFYVNGISC